MVTKMYLIRGDAITYQTVVFSRREQDKIDRDFSVRFCLSGKDNITAIIYCSLEV